MKKTMKDDKMEFEKISRLLIKGVRSSFSSFILHPSSFIIYLLLASSAFAQTKENLKIGFVDFDRVVKDSRYIQSMVSSINAEAKRFQDQIEKNLARHQRLSNQLSEQKTVLSKNEIETRREEMKKLQSETEDLQYQLEKLLKKSKSESINPALEKAMKVVEQIGRDEGYDLILNGETVLFAAKSTNLTTQVIEKLDSKKSDSSEEKSTSGSKSSHREGKTPSVEK